MRERSIWRGVETAMGRMVPRRGAPGRIERGRRARPPATGPRPAALGLPLAASARRPRPRAGARRRRPGRRRAVPHADRSPIGAVPSARLAPEPPRGRRMLRRAALRGGRRAGRASARRVWPWRARLTIPTGRASPRAWTPTSPTSCCATSSDVPGPRSTRSTRRCCSRTSPGFTKLSERLARRGREGAEELVEAIGTSLSALLRRRLRRRRQPAEAQRRRPAAALRGRRARSPAPAASALGMRRMLRDVGRLETLGRQA